MLTTRSAGNPPGGIGKRCSGKSDVGACRSTCADELMPGVVAAFHVFWALGDVKMVQMGAREKRAMGDAAPHREQRGDVADGCLHQQTQLNRTNV